MGSLVEPVAFGDVVHINCTGLGSYVTTNWTFNNCWNSSCNLDTIMCNNESCDSGFLEYSENLDIINPDTQNRQIFSTLSINTSQLNTCLQSEQQDGFNFTIICMVEQVFPSDINLQEYNSSSFLTIVEVLPPPGKIIVIIIMGADHCLNTKTGMSW